jgi:hypothetical protein
VHSADWIRHGRILPQCIARIETWGTRFSG